MKTLLRLILLLGVMTGLLGQSTALAMAPVAHSSMAAMADMDNCAGMADGPMHGDGPCKKMTWQCIAAMGCVTAAIALPTFTTDPVRRTARLAHVRPVIAALIGRSVAPELDPPAFRI